MEWKNKNNLYIFRIYFCFFCTWSQNGNIYCHCWVYVFDQRCLQMTVEWRSNNCGKKQEKQNKSNSNQDLIIIRYLPKSSPHDGMWDKADFFFLTWAFRAFTIHLVITGGLLAVYLSRRDSILWHSFVWVPLCLKVESLTNWVLSSPDVWRT